MVRCTHKCSDIVERCEDSSSEEIVVAYQDEFQVFNVLMPGKMVHNKECKLYGRLNFM